MLNNPRILSIVLLLQIVLVFVLSYDGSNTKTDNSKAALISLENLQLDKIIIDDSISKVELFRKGQEWILPGYYNLPANTGTFSAFINALKKMRSKWPIAKTAEASGRFQVANNNYKRRIILFAHDKQLAELYLGKSPGYKKQYVRKAGESSIYTVQFGLHLSPASAMEWFDKGFLKLKMPVDEIAGEDFLLKKQKEQWMLADKKEQEKLNRPEMERLINYLLHIQVKEVAGSERVKELTSGKPVQIFSLKSHGKSFRFEFYKKDKQMLLKTGQSDLYFIVPVYIAENIEKINRKAFIQ